MALKDRVYSYPYADKLKIKRLYLRNNLTPKQICEKMPQYNPKQIRRFVSHNGYTKQRKEMEKQVDQIVDSATSSLLADQAEFANEVAERAQSLTIAGMDACENAVHDSKAFANYTQGIKNVYGVYREASGLDAAVNTHMNRGVSAIHQEPLRRVNEPVEVEAEIVESVPVAKTVKAIE